MTIEQIFETTRFLALRYSFYQGKIGFVLVDKKSKKSFLSNWDFDSSGVIINDLDGGPKLLPDSYLVENDRDYIIELIGPYQIKTHVLSMGLNNSVSKFLAKKGTLIKLGASLNNADYSIIVSKRLKM